ncbi:MAG: extracellular solute-binding protein [Ruminococcaceae bacterium]|nr:extracellular solute-binding protein [Oscillospiraceae bacterium]
MKKRILATIMSVLLIVCTLLSLAACAGGKEDEKGPGEEVIVRDWYDNLGEHDLNGYTVKFAVAETDGDGFHKRSIAAEEDTGDAVDAAIFARNKAIESRFSCTIELTFYTDTSNLSNALSSVFMSGGEEYDVIAARQYDDISICSKGYVLDLSKNEYTSQYLEWKDNEFPYWGEGYVEGMSYKGQVYWLAGDLCLRYTGGFYCTFVNGTIYDEAIKESQGSIYDLVREKKWTIDKMRELSDAATTVENTTMTDLIGSDGVIGIAMPVWDNTNGWAVAAGVNFSTTNKDGSISFTFNEKNTRLDTFYKKYMQVLGSKGVINTGGNYVEAFQAFASDNALMVAGRLNQAELYLREMSSPYYIVPCPLLDETQESYRSNVHDGISLYGISAGSEDVKATAIVLEALCAESYRSVRPRYYEDALKFKYTTDLDSAEMIDILSENAYMDFVLVWAFSSYFNGIGNYLRSCMNNGTASVSSQLKKQTSVWNRGLKTIDEVFMKLAESGQ